jgi:TPP-dependent pyruvate/acetoin dehydrogenase alpha subunit
MKTLMTKEELIAFEDDIATCFNNKLIKAPVHLDSGNEEQLIEIFKEVDENDFVCCTWRAHYRCLLKGVPPEQLKADILAGKSITLCYKEHNIFSSAIVGGIIPIALGIAFDLKRKQSNQKVWCFIGDMSSYTGVFHEALEYATNFDLPIVFVIEDNNKSVCTNTRKSWGLSTNYVHPLGPWLGDKYERGDVFKGAGKFIRYYEYESKYPHAGAGARIQF